MENRYRTKHLLSIAALALLFGSASVQAQTSSSSTGSSAQSGAAASADKSGGKSGAKSTLSKAEQNMMRDMAHANLSEIATGELALKQSQNDQVKAYAQKMIDDHSQAQKELEQLAQSKGVTLPTEPDMKHKAAMKALGKLEGEKFDKMYMAQGGVRDHKNTHQLLEKGQKSAKDPELQAHVKKVTPIVEQHLTMAQEHTGKKSGKSGSSGSSGSSSSGSGSSGSGSSGSGSSGSGSSGSGSSGSGTASSSGGTASGSNLNGTPPSGSSGTGGTSGSSNSTGPNK